MGRCMKKVQKHWSRFNPESHWLVNGSFLPTESFCKKYLFSVTSLWYSLVQWRSQGFCSGVASH